jgi:molecular chaperone GrpE
VTARQGDPAAPRASGAAEQSAQPAGTPDAGPAAEVPDTGAVDDVGNDVAADLVAAQEAVKSLTDDLQRLQAEYVNYKRRVDRDRELVLQNARFTILSALLPVLDDLDRAREHGELEGGFKAVADSLERIVAGQGLVKFGKPGDEFDPRFHEALMHSHSADVSTTTCQTVITAGYQIADRVVRPARVTVVDPEPDDGPSDGAAESGGEPGQAPAPEAGSTDPSRDDAGQDGASRNDQ